MIELGDKVETYDVSVATLIPVKRLVRVQARSDSHARQVAIEQVQQDFRDGSGLEWAIPQKSRSDVDSDLDLLGPYVTLHVEAFQQPLYTGLCPKKVSE